MHPRGSSPIALPGDERAARTGGKNFPCGFGFWILCPSDHKTLNDPHATTQSYQTEAVPMARPVVSCQNRKPKTMMTPIIG